MVVVCDSVSPRALVAPDGRDVESWTTRALIDSSVSPLVLFDAAGRVITMNAACAALTGFTGADAVGRPVWELLPTLEDGEPGSPWTGFREGGAAPDSLEQITTDEIGNRRRIHWTYVSVGPRPGTPAHIVGTGVDITGQRIAETAWRRQAETDPLTGLPNRAVFKTSIAQHADRLTGLGCGVLFCDLDGFKSINDTLGHAAGDEVLVQIANRLTTTVRAGDLVARFGGDEFAVLLPAVGLLQMRALATRMERFVCQPLRLSAGRAKVGISIGLAALAPGEDPAVAMHAADAAMYAVKARRTARQAQNA